MIESLYLTCFDGSNRSDLRLSARAWRDVVRTTETPTLQLTLEFRDDWICV